jgi:hypothetical protein
MLLISVSLIEKLVTGDYKLESICEKKQFFRSLARELLGAKVFF